MSDSFKVGIYIPTLNKPDFVIRQIKYYASLNSPHPVYIGDNSSPENAQILQKALENFKNKLEINYIYRPAEQAESQLNLVSQIKEKYAAFVGDDDFLVPNSLTKCAQFLENNPDYSLASGLAVSFSLDRPGPYGKIVNLSDYPRPEVLEEKGKDRLMDYLNRYHVTLFSVARTADLKRDWELSVKAKDRSFQTEIMLGTLAIVRGKSKTLDCLSLVRQMHDSRQPSPDIFDWLAKPDWAETYQYFLEVLAKELTKIDVPNERLAKKIVKEAMWLYIQNHLVSGHLIPNQNKNYLNLFKKTFVKIPFAKKIFYKYINPKLKNGLGRSMHYQVSQPWSLYYQDWQEIKKAL